MLTVRPIDWLGLGKARDVLRRSIPARKCVCHNEPDRLVLF